MKHEKHTGHKKTWRHFANHLLQEGTRHAVHAAYNHFSHPKAHVPHRPRHGQVTNTPKEGRVGEVHSSTSIIREPHISKLLTIHKSSKLSYIDGASQKRATAAGVVRGNQAVQLYNEDIAYPTLLDIRAWWTDYWIQAGVLAALVQPPGLTTGIDPQKATNTQDILFEYIKKEYTFSNMAATGCYFTIWDLELKGSGSMTALTSGDNAVTQKWISGLIDQTQIPTATDQTHFVGEDPMKSERVRAAYKFVKKHHKFLSPGEIWIHRTYNQFRRKLKGELFADIATTNDDALPGSLALVWTASGVPCTATVADAICTTTPCMIGCIVRTTVKFSPCSMPFNNKFDQITQGLSVVTNPLVQNPETDATVTAGRLN